MTTLLNMTGSSGQDRAELVKDLGKLITESKKLLHKPEKLKTLIQGLVAIQNDKKVTLEDDAKEIIKQQLLAVIAEKTLDEKKKKR